MLESSIYAFLWQLSRANLPVDCVKSTRKLLVNKFGHVQPLNHDHAQLDLSPNILKSV